MSDMTLGELREELATMGANDEERNAPVEVTFAGAVGTYTITEVQLQSWDDGERGGLTLLLQAAQSR